MHERCGFAFLNLKLALQDTPDPNGGVPSSEILIIFLNVGRILLCAH